jgi:glycine cleavage system H protein
MSLLPEHLKYSLSHEWAQIEDDNIVRVGITDFAQDELGDLVFVDLPKINQKVIVNQCCATIESVKTASDIHSPVSGEIIEINQSVVDNPEKITDSPYESWLFCVKADNLAEIEKLLSHTDYQTMITA